MELHNLTHFKHRRNHKDLALLAAL